MTDSTATAPTTAPSPTSPGLGATASTQTASAIPNPTPTIAEEPRYKAGPGVPEWMVGKSMTEAAALTQQLYHQLISASPAPTAFNLPTTAGATVGAPSPHIPGAPDPDEFLHDPAGATQRLLN